MTTDAETLTRPGNCPPNPPPPMLLNFGGHHMVTLSGKPNLPDHLWEPLMLALAGEGDIEEAIARAEQFMGIGEYHRIIAWTDAGLMSEAEAEARRAATTGLIAEKAAVVGLSELAHVLALGAPLRDPFIVAEIEDARTGAADARAEAAQLRDADPKRHRKKIKALEAIARSLDAKAEAARLRELEEDRIMGEAREPVLCARARGAEVSLREFEAAEIARDEYGARIVHRRGTKRGLPVLVYDKARRAQILTGIEHAFAQGYLDDAKSPGQAEALLEIGQIYAQAFQALDPLGAANTEGGGGGGFGPKAPQVRHVEAGETLKIMRARLLPRQVAVLDAVCGEDKRLGEVAATRGTLPGLKRRLRLALRVAAQNWRAPDSKRRLAKVRADVMAGRVALGRVG